ncbi:MAG TPA: helix-turn-helix domain-containing protein [Candidatus Limnocylindrales bacterium]|nr:helix-turn-helix domain-containing protein [Candidatus Limnocylindrales bacterium]
MRASSTSARIAEPTADGDASTGRAITAAIAEAGVNGEAAERLRAAVVTIAEQAIAAAGQRQSEQVERLLATAGRVTESLDLDTVLTAIVDDARALLRADSGDMLLWDRERDRLRVVAVSKRPTDLLGFEMDFGEGMSTQAILRQRTIWVDDYSSYPHRARALDRYTFGSVICAPLIFRGEAIGALNLHATQGGHRFGPEDADLLAAFAGHAAIAIDHARRYENEVHLGRVLAETNAELSRSLAVQQRLAEQVLLDRGPAGIAEVLAEHLGRRVVIRDHIRRVIAGASPDGGEDWRQLVEDSTEPEPFSVAVRVGREVAGHLVLSAEQDLAPIDRALVDVAVTGVALEFAKIRATLEVEERLRGEAMADLFNGTYPDEAAMAARAARLGHDLSRPHDLVVIDVRPTTAAGSSSVSAPGTAVDLDTAGALATPHDVDRGLTGLVREHLAKRAPRSVTVLHGGSIVVLAAQPRRGDGDARPLAAELMEMLEGTAGAASVTISLGGTCVRPDAYAPAFAAARRALDLMLKLGRPGTIIGARELGPYGLLLQASGRDDLEEFARSALAPIIDYDRQHGADLLGTLRVYLDEDRVQRRAAARCFIHVNTVVYRINRIEQLLDRSLNDPSTVFDLTLALRIMDVTEGATPASTR